MIDSDFSFDFERTGQKNVVSIRSPHNPVTNLDTNPFSDSLVGQTKMKQTYREQARLAQRWFTLKDDRVEIEGRDRGRKFSREFRYSDLSGSTQHFVQLRHDMMWRCLSLLAVATILAALAARIDHALGMVALGICLLLVAKFAWMAFGWSYQKVEAVIFRRSNGDEAFVIFTDKPGDPEFTDFVRCLRSSIANSTKKETQALENNARDLT